MDRCVLITGCSSGIGHATARAFHEEGWDVVATSRTAETLESLSEIGCWTLSLDVTDESSIQSVVDSIEVEFGRLDCLVNNAGYAQLGPLEDIPIDRLKHQFAVNVFGVHRLTNAVLPLLRESHRGSIVSVSSSTTAVPLPGTGAYAGSKAALETMHDALRSELAGSDINVVLVRAGTVNTAFATRAKEELNSLHRSPSYQSVYRLLDDWLAFDGGGPGAVEPETVARRILHAASATQPEPEYVVGPIGKLATLAAVIPAKFRDRALAVVFRLLNPRGTK